MNVDELIESLKGFNPNARVGVKTIDDLYVDKLYVSYICKDADGNDLDEKETEQVYIEAIDFCVNCQFFDNNNCLAYDCDVSEVDECYQFCENLDED